MVLVCDCPLLELEGAEEGFCSENTERGRRGCSQ